MNLLRTFNPRIYDLTENYKVTDEALMPEEYRYPDGRWKHDDFVFFKDITRKSCARRVPQPFRIKKGEKRQEWMLFDPAYPLSPGTQTKIENGLMYVMADRGGYGLVEYEAFLDGRWVSVFWKYTGIWFGKRLSWYRGLHQDQHVSPPSAPSGFRSDLMCWLEPPITASWIKEV